MSQSNAQRIAELECLISGKRYQIDMITAAVVRLEKELEQLRKPAPPDLTSRNHSTGTLLDHWDEIRKSRSI